MPMTEAEWLNCSEPLEMLVFLGDQASERKMRLFACASCRVIWSLLAEPDLRNAVETAEQFVDKLVGLDELVAAYSAISGSIASNRHIKKTIRGFARGAVAFATSSPPAFADDGSGRFSGWCAAIHAAEEAATAWSGTLGTLAAGKATQCHLLRYIFVRPWLQITVQPYMFMPSVNALAQAIYDERLFEDLPILADALEEAGCTNQHILRHCRQPGEHVRGCWVIDLLLGKK
jgi:hypothetical protein